MKNKKYIVGMRSCQCKLNLKGLLVIANSVSFFQVYWGRFFFGRLGQGPENSHRFPRLGICGIAIIFGSVPTDQAHPDGTTLTPKKHRSFSDPGSVLSCNEKYQQDAAVNRGHGDWHQIKRAQSICNS